MLPHASYSFSSGPFLNGCSQSRLSMTFISELIEIATWIFCFSFQCCSGIMSFDDASVRWHPSSSRHDDAYAANNERRFFSIKQKDFDSIHHFFQWHSGTVTCSNSYSFLWDGSIVTLLGLLTTDNESDFNWFLQIQSHVTMQNDDDRRIQVSCIMTKLEGLNRSASSDVGWKQFFNWTFCCVEQRIFWDAYSIVQCLSISKRAETSNKDERYRNARTSLSNKGNGEVHGNTRELCWVHVNIDALIFLFEVFLIKVIYESAKSIKANHASESFR